MENLLSLLVVCAVILLIGWLYSAISQIVRRKMAKPIKEVEADDFPWPSHRP